MVDIFYIFRVFKSYETMESQPYPCNSGLGIIIIHVLIILSYVSVTFILVVFTKGVKRKDYLKFLLMVVVPIILLYAYLVFNNLYSLQANIHQFK